MARRRLKLTWSPRARRHLREILQRIRDDDRLAAKRFLQRIKAFANRLKEQPRIGRVVPEFGLEHLRERIFGNYRIVYRLQGEEEVLEGEIVAVIHTRREMPELN